MVRLMALQKTSLQTIIVTETRINPRVAIQTDIREQKVAIESVSRLDFGSVPVYHRG
jgi:hypothetical protein